MKEGNPVTHLFFNISEKKFNLSDLGDFSTHFWPEFYQLVGLLLLKLSIN